MIVSKNEFPCEGRVIFTKNSAANKNMRNLPSFGAGFVTLSEKNLGPTIKEGIVDVFNKVILPDMRKAAKVEASEIIFNLKPSATAKIQTSDDLVNKVNFFSLAAGSGSRFEKLAKTVGNFNKISLPLYMKDGKKFQMLDIPMAMGKHFLGKDGYQAMMAQKKSGSMGDIIKYYLNGGKIKDTIVCCGDNVFGVQAKELTSFFIKAINNEGTHLALVGVKRTPEEVAKRFGVLKVEQGKNAVKGVMNLAGFEEKPPLKVAKALATAEGDNIANTGMFYIGEEAMTKLVNEIKGGVNNIGKDAGEPYDFALATKYIHKQLPEWFGVESTKGAKVKIVDKWEDVGEPKAYYNFLKNAGKKGVYLENLPPKHAQEIQETIAKKTNLTGAYPEILYSKNLDSLAEVPSNVRQKAKTVEGVKIIVD